MRLDQALVARGLSRTRSQAREAILRGAVRVDGIVATRAGLRVVDASALEASSAATVGRGSLKLAAALDHFAIDVAGCLALDVGASTGGFTEVLLERGARSVIALDVGRGQLAQQLAEDPRVVQMEGINARHLRPADLPYAPDVVVVDVSFISLALVLPAVVDAAASAMTLVALVKPQFEVGRAHVGKGGIVRDNVAAAAAVERVAVLVGTMGLTVRAPIASPINGGDGNREFVLAARR
ncbi:TlyA family RNA methyltransferase [Acuticoccus sp.]|uniref:TlyA family RNA methyltransferase n=1 Tax=Acuticoccus sp. TaxID=1904378 RepID=UPI003B52FD8D